MPPAAVLFLYRYATHEQATHAICEMNGALVEGFNVKVLPFLVMYIILHIIV